MGDSDLGGVGGVEFWRAEAERWRTEVERLTAEDIVLRARVVDLEGQGRCARREGVGAGEVGVRDVVGEGGHAVAR